jgi:hypothetical protein
MNPELLSLLKQFFEDCVPALRDERSGDAFNIGHNLAREKILLNLETADWELLGKKIEDIMKK